MRAGEYRAVAIAAMAPTAWGTTYLVTTELLPANRPFLAAALRALPAGLLLLAFTRTLPRGRWWAKAAVLGMLNIGAFFALLFTARTTLTKRWGRRVPLLAFTSWQLVAGGAFLLPLACSVRSSPPPSATWSASASAPGSCRGRRLSSPPSPPASGRPSGTPLGGRSPRPFPTRRSPRSRRTEWAAVQTAA
jgi:drug/metabolite transporter (DMT)-like permease